MRLARAGAIVAGISAAAIAATSVRPAVGDEPATSRDRGAATSTTTPIKHLVVIFQENVSFDHYFGTYPLAKNPAGEPTFTARPDTPEANTLDSSHDLGGALLTDNPNQYNGVNANPQRLDRSEPLTCDQGHDYTPEQNAANHGAEDSYIGNTSNGAPATPKTRAQCDTAPGHPTADSRTPDYAVLDYYDGNTVTGLWNYAQRFAMSDNSYGTGYGPSTPGALNVTAGNTYGVQCDNGGASTALSGGEDPNVYGTVPPCPGGTSSTGAPPVDTPAKGTVVGDPDQYFDDCSNPKYTAALGGDGVKNIGDELTAKGVSWGWFNGGFQNQGYVPGRPATSTVATSKCTAAHYNIGAGAQDGKPCIPKTPGDPNAAFCVSDYSAHHEPFQYFQSTSNPHHTAPSSIEKIGGNGDGANHQYDLADFWAAAQSGHLPAVSYLKARKFQDGHAGYSDPLDEQHFLVDSINRLQRLPEWKSTAVVVAYDDSDGWYDHVLAPVQIQSQTALDTLTNPGQCGPSANRVPKSNTGRPEQARCGYGPRLPLLVISPWAKRNYIDHSITDQSSVVRFIEDNWKVDRLGNGSADRLAGTLNGMFDFGGGEDRDSGRLFLDPQTGQPRSPDDPQTRESREDGGA